MIYLKYVMFHQFSPHFIVQIYQNFKYLKNQL